MTSPDRESEIKRIIDDHPGLNQMEIIKRASMAKDTTTKTLKNLVEKGEITAREEGKMIRYFPREAHEKDLMASVTDALDSYVEYLSTIKKDLPTYPYDMLNALNNKILRHSDELKNWKKRLEGEFEYENRMDDTMRYYDEYRLRIHKVLNKCAADGDMERRIYTCLSDMRARVHAIASRQLKLKKKREKYGKNEKRNSISKEIDLLESSEEELLTYVNELSTSVDKLGPNSDDKFHYRITDPLRIKLERVEQHRSRFQDMLEATLNEVNGLPDGKPEAKSGLEETIGQMEDMKRTLVKTEEVVRRSYMDAREAEVVREINSLVANIEKHLGKL